MRLKDDLEYQRLRHAVASIGVAILLVVAVGVGLNTVWPDLWTGLGGDVAEEEEEDDGGTVASGPPGVERLAGGDRFGTSAVLATRLWPEGADAVVIATGADYADALAGGPVAAALDAPLLLATSDGLPPDVAEALAALQPAEVVLMGGEGALSAALAEQVAGLPGQPSVTRIAGPTRFETAGLAAERAGRAGDADVAVATGFDFPDAVASGALTAGERPVPVLLAAGAELPVPLAAGERALLIGGTAALPLEVEALAADQAGAVERLAGGDRFATSLAVADLALRTRLEGRVALVVATGEQFPDALSAGAVAARAGGPLLLVPGAGPTDEQAAWLAGVRDRLDRVLVVGGTGAVSDEGVARLRDIVRGDAEG